MRVPNWPQSKENLCRQQWISKEGNWVKLKRMAQNEKSLPGGAERGRALPRSGVPRSKSELSREREVGKKISPSSGWRQRQRSPPLPCPLLCWLQRFYDRPIGIRGLLVSSSRAGIREHQERLVLIFVRLGFQSLQLWDIHMRQKRGTNLILRFFVNVLSKACARSEVIQKCRYTSRAQPNLDCSSSSHVAPVRWARALSKEVKLMSPKYNTCAKSD